MRCPACNGKSLPDRDGLRRCQRKECGGLFDPSEIASGRVEGGDFDDRDPAARLKLQESGGPGGYAIKHNRKLKGGLN